MERIELTSPHDLPGAHDSDKGGGRQALIDYAGRYWDAEIAAVEGRWEHDLFVVEVVEDPAGNRARIDRRGRIIPQSRKEATNV